MACRIFDNDLLLHMMFKH